MSNNYDFLFKFIIIGDSSVGKSCLLLRYTEGRFKCDHEPTLGVQFGSKTMNIDKYIIKTQVWDTIKAGQESFKAITRSYYKNSIAAFLVFDLTRRDSFQNLNKWIFEVKNNSHDKIQAVVVGNKSDLKQNRQVSFQEGQKFANLHGFTYIQTSAQTGSKVEDVFKSVADKIVRLIETNKIDPDCDSSYGIKRGKLRKEDPKSPQRNHPNQRIALNQQAPTQPQKCCSK